LTRSAFRRSFRRKIKQGVPFPKFASLCLALDQVALAIEPLAEAELPAPVALGRDVGRGALVLDQLADAIGVVGLIRQHDGSRDEMVEQRVGDLPVMRLPCRQAEPDREPLRVDDDVDLCREPGA